RGRGGGEPRSHSDDGSFEPVVDEGAPALLEITPLPIEIPGSITQAELVTVAVPAHRRGGRGRGSAASAAPVAASSAVEPAAAAPAPAESAVSAAEEEDAGEPRRRRRRSSATV
ncbi:MAG: hypothetical protein ACKO25_09440, partial [Cyanobium sp.]